MNALLVARRPALVADATAILEKSGFRVVAAASLEDVDADATIDVAIVEAADHESGIDAIRRIRRKAEGVPVLVLTPAGSGGEAELIGAGAADVDDVSLPRTRLEARVALLARKVIDGQEQTSSINFHGLPLTTIMEAMDDIIEVNSPEIVIEYVNPAFERVMGWSREEAIGETPAKLFASGAHDREFFEEMERTIVGGRTWRGVLISRTKSGEFKHLESTIAPVINSAGVVTHRVAIKRDITNRLHHERLLHESEERYALAVRGSAEGIWDYQVAAKKMFFSARWEEIAGVPEGTMGDSFQAWLDLIAEGDRHAVETAFRDHLMGRTPHFVSEHRIVRPDGSSRWVRARGVAQRDENGTVLRIAGSLADTTALKQAYQQVESARDRAIEANRTKSLFLANMSHELRTPLNAIIGYSEMLMEDAEDEGHDDALADLNRIKSSASHLLALINDVLDISKIEAGKMELYLETFPVDSALDAIATQIGPLIEKNDNTFVFDAAADLGSMRADLTKLRQTLLNLLGNANKFTKRGEIKLSARRDGDTLEFEVRDTGIGMSDEQLARLFQPFVQGDASTTRRYGGTGLGLTISQRFCEMMGGKITVESDEGSGSAFTVVLPAQVRPASKKRERDQGAAVDVLLIDDDSAMRDLLARSLGRRGYVSRSAANGQEGLMMAREQAPDVIVLDVMMPGLDGWTVLSELKNDPELAAIPVVMLTVVDQRELGLMLGAAEYLLKPVDPGQLTAVLDRVRGTRAPSPVLVVEDDPDTRELLGRVLRGDGWTVASAENGRVALDALGEGAVPDAIVLDLMMPEMDGFEFLAHLRKNPAWRQIPVVVVTAKELTEEDRAVLAGSVERVLEKGAYSKEELVDMVHEVVRGATGDDEDQDRDKDE